MILIAKVITFLKHGLLVLISAYALTTNADPYSLIVGSTTSGMYEYNQQDIHLGFKSAYNEILATDNIQSDFKTYSSINELHQALETGEINAMFGTSLEFIKTESLLNTNDIIAGLQNGVPKSSILLLVRKDSGLSSLLQLKNKKIIIPGWLSDDIGKLYLETLLLSQEQKGIKDFFSDVKFTKSSNKALVALMFNQADAVLIRDSFFKIAADLNPQIRAQLKAIEISEPYLLILTAVSKKTPAKEMASIKNKLLSLQNTKKGKNILGILKLDGFEEVSMSDINQVKELVTKNKSLQKDTPR